jgi:hypothetical protein
MPTNNDANGTPQRINDKGFALNVCATMQLEAHAGDEGDTYTALYSGDPGGTDADFLYFKNTSDKALRIYKIKIYCTADVEVTIKTGVTGTPSNTSTITPVNALIGSGSLAEGDFYSRAGDLALTGGNTFDSLIYDAASNNEVVWNYTGEIALQKNQTILWNNVTDPNASIRMTVYFYYHEPIE